MVISPTCDPLPSPRSRPCPIRGSRIVRSAFPQSTRRSLVTRRPCSPVQVSSRRIGRCACALCFSLSLSTRLVHPRLLGWFVCRQYARSLLGTSHLLSTVAGHQLMRGAAVFAPSPIVRDQVLSSPGLLLFLLCQQCILSILLLGVGNSPSISPSAMFPCLLVSVASRGGCSQ